MWEEMGKRRGNVVKENVEGETYTLVLDLDETLVHSYEINSRR